MHHNAVWETINKKENMMNNDRAIIIDEIKSEIQLSNTQRTYEICFSGTSELVGKRFIIKIGRAHV